MSMWALNHWRWLVGVAAGLLLFGAGWWMGDPLLAKPVQPVVVELPCPPPGESEATGASEGKGIAPPAHRDVGKPVLGDHKTDEPEQTDESAGAAPVNHPPQGLVDIHAGRIDINAATVEELQALPGIGPVLAQRIVAYREQWGPFQHVVDLLEVSGIGPRLLERLKPHISVGP